MRPLKQQCVVPIVEAPLAVGDRALKIGGSFTASGVIVAAFETTEGAQRYVFEFETPKGMLHLYSANQLEAVVEHHG